MCLYVPYTDNSRPRLVRPIHRLQRDHGTTPSQQNNTDQSPWTFESMSNVICFLLRIPNLPQRNLYDWIPHPPPVPIPGLHMYFPSVLHFRPAFALNSVCHCLNNCHSLAFGRPFSLPHHFHAMTSSFRMNHPLHPSTHPQHVVTLRTNTPAPMNCLLCWHTTMSLILRISICF